MTFRRIVAEIAAGCHILAVAAGDPGKHIVPGELRKTVFSAFAVDERVDPHFQSICAENGFWTMHEGSVRTVCWRGNVTGKVKYRERG